MMEKVRPKIWTVYDENPIGTGNWRWFSLDWDNVVTASRIWREAVSGHQSLWLCWNVNDAWCLVQQELVSEIGWTPVVGWDPMCGVNRPPLVRNAIALDFANDLKIPGLFMHVPLELAFLWVDNKLAFWHSDLLPTRKKMKELSHLYASLNENEMAAVYSYGGLRKLLNKRYRRYWELCGCTTREISLDQYEKGAGWWRNIASHPNAPNFPNEIEARKSIHNEHGVGIRYWEQNYGGKIRRISERSLAKYHFSVTSVQQYQLAETKAVEMDINFDISQICRDLAIFDIAEKYGLDKRNNSASAS